MFPIMMFQRPARGGMCSLWGSRFPSILDMIHLFQVLSRCYFSERSVKYEGVCGAGPLFVNIQQPFHQRLLKRHDGT